MSKKYKVLRVVKGVISTPGAASSGRLSKETEELAKIDAELVEVGEGDKNMVIAALKDADIILFGGVPIPDG